MRLTYVKARPAPRPQPRRPRRFDELPLALSGPDPSPSQPSMVPSTSSGTRLSMVPVPSTALSDRSRTSLRRFDTSTSSVRAGSAQASSVRAGFRGRHHSCVGIAVSTNSRWLSRVRIPPLRNHRWSLRRFDKLSAGSSGTRLSMVPVPSTALSDRSRTSLQRFDASTLRRFDKLSAGKLSAGRLSAGKLSAGNLRDQAIDGPCPFDTLRRPLRTSPGRRRQSGPSPPMPRR